MEQAGYVSFSCDLRRPIPKKLQQEMEAAGGISPTDGGVLPPLGAGYKNLVLSRKPLIPREAQNVVKLVDLTPFGDPVKHYACPIEELTVNGITLGGRGSIARPEVASKPIFAIFDTGSTGMGISRELFDVLFEQQVCMHCAPSSYAVGSKATRE
jgi:hypothetical protein